jgi:catechol 2,3-dioxygenase-like lactoylglutathione lyase family enzyme
MAQEPSGFRVEGVDHVALRVSDQAGSIAWYRGVLGLDRVHEEEWGDVPAMMVAHGSGVALFPADGAAGQGPEFMHVAFRVDRRTFDGARARLADLGIETRFANHGVAHSIYFTDPDGHRLELTTYELEDA